MKPNTKLAMEKLILCARKTIPFNLSFDGYCEGRCDECPEKLLEYLDILLLDWEDKLKKGVTPDLGHVHSLADDCKKIYKILWEKGFVKEKIETIELEKI